MSYANSDFIKNKSLVLIEKLSEHLKLVKQDEHLFFRNGETIYVPDIHGDFVHLITTLYKHGVLEISLNLKKDFKYVFLGDFYDRAPDSDVVDFWLNSQIKNGNEIYRLIGNHEMAFLERNVDGYPIIFPSQDSIKDASNNFQITECLLKNIAEGNLIAAYVDGEVLYVHSYIISDDFVELGLDKNADILNFVIALNERFHEHGRKSYEVFLDCKKKNEYDWEAVIKPFKDDSLFDITKTRNEINTSFLWRRTGVTVLNIFPAELEAPIPDNVYQIVGHTPVFSFNIPNKQSVTSPFILSLKDGSGKVQFSDVGIGYYYKKDSFERPEVVINKALSIILI